MMSTPPPAPDQLPPPAPDDQLRADAGRTISRLQQLVGQQAGQILQLEDIVEQLQERLADATAELARAANAKPPAGDAS